LGLVQESMAHAERIIKTVMLPIGTPPSSTAFAAAAGSAAQATSGTAGALTAAAAAAAAVSTNPFDAPSARPEEPSNASPVMGFVMGPVDAKAAETFVKSFFQLLPDADVSVLQKILDMKVGWCRTPATTLFPYNLLVSIILLPPREGGG
uniref:UCH domain-containing protein n=1 Tax=Schistocephalus solidus TaxID=70667 RepID=A0A183TT71_SCHSO